MSNNRRWQSSSDLSVILCYIIIPIWPIWWLLNHDDVIKWKHFPRYWPFVRRIHRSPVNSPHKGQWRGALMFSLICARINGWVNNREADDLRRHQAHCDVIIMWNICLTGRTLPTLPTGSFSAAFMPFRFQCSYNLSGLLNLALFIVCISCIFFRSTRQVISICTIPSSGKRTIYIQYSVGISPTVPLHQSQILQFICQSLEAQQS